MVSTQWTATGFRIMNDKGRVRKRKFFYTSLLSFCRKNFRFIIMLLCFQLILSHSASSKRLMDRKVIKLVLEVCMQLKSNSSTRR